LPTAQEVVAAEKFLADQSARLKSKSGENLALPSPAPPAPSLSASDAAALVDLCLAMFNLNEFIYLD
jgi:hypothetical protein